MKASDWLNDTRHGIARSIRPGQVAMASLVEGILENGGIGFLEAGTGTGKSFAYAIPAILSGKKVVVSTATKALQEQLVDKDLPLLRELAAARPDLRIVLVGPSSLDPAATADLASAGVQLLGPRPYHQVPAYLQHADVVIVPHVVSPFTESLDPIKAYECAAAGRPTVATPVAGFRSMGPPVTTADRDGFAAAVSGALTSGSVGPTVGAVPSWQDRTEALAAVMDRIRSGRGR